MYKMLYMLYFARSPVRRNWPSSSDCALFKMFRLDCNHRTAFVGFRKNIFQRRRFRLDISFHLIHPLILALVMEMSSLNRFTSYLYFLHQLWPGHHWTDLPVTFTSGISYGEVIIEQIYQLPLLVASVMARSSLNRFTSYLYFWHQLWWGHHWTDLPVTFTCGISYGKVIVEQIYQLPYFWHQLWRGYH